MKIEVARQPDEKTREVWQLRLQPDTMAIHPVRFELWEANDEHAPLLSKGFWKWPDILGESTMEKPALPEWAKQDAITFVTNQIRFT